MVERSTVNRVVVGSKPTWGVAILYGMGEAPAYYVRADKEYGTGVTVGQGLRPCSSMQK